MIKAIFFDIDGTLLSFKTHKISDKSLQALHKAKEKGIKLFIATGRHKSETDHFNGFPFDGYVTLNGQYCCNSEEVIFKNPIKPHEVETFISILKETPFPSIFLEEKDMYLNMVNEEVENMMKIIKINKLRIDKPEIALGKEIYQLITFKTEEDEMELMKQLPGCDATRWHPDFIDIIPKGGSKRVGIEKMLEYYKLLPEEIMAIGDGGNDIEMLDLAEVSVAMGNASDEVKKHASYITTDVDNEGVYNALKHFHIID